MKKIYKCSCGELNEENFYKKNTKTCKACVLKREKSKYQNMSEIDRLSYIYKQKKWIGENLVQSRVLAAKHRAIRKNIEFDLDIEYINNLLIIQDFKCKYSGQILETTYDNIDDNENRVNKNIISIDRIDPSKGYVKNNIALVTGAINIMKNDLSEDEFIYIIKSINNFFEKT